MWSYFRFSWVLWCWFLELTWFNQYEDISLGINVNVHLDTFILSLNSELHRPSIALCHVDLILSFLSAFMDSILCNMLIFGLSSNCSYLLITLYLHSLIFLLKPVLILLGLSTDGRNWIFVTLVIIVLLFCQEYLSHGSAEART